MARRQPSSPTRIAEILGSVVARLGVERNLDDYRVWQAWDEVVGPAIARNAQPLRLDAKRLVVAVRNNVWMQELSLLREELRERINRWMKREVVGEIFLVVGKIEAGSSPSRAPAETRAAAPARFQRRQEPSAGERVRAELQAAIERLWRQARGQD